MQQRQRTTIFSLAAIAGVFVCAALVRLSSGNRGIPFTHKREQTRLCEEYAKQSGESYTSGTHEPVRTETFFSERLGTCIQAQTFAPNDYSIVDLTKGYSESTWLFVCGPQGLYRTTFFGSAAKHGDWVEEGPRSDRPCERLFAQTIGEIQ
jgi:hypothetical protein